MNWKTFYAEEYEILAAKMDKQDAYFRSLWEFADKNGADIMPPEHSKGWLLARIHGRKSWRQIPKVRRRIKKAAIKAAKNRLKNAVVY
jgi:hypothetical protein